MTGALNINATSISALSLNKDDGTQTIYFDTDNVSFEMTNGSAYLYWGVDSTSFEISSIGGNWQLGAAKDQTLTLLGNLNVSGSATLGAGTADDVVINGRIKSNLIPDADNTYAFGDIDNSLAWSTIQGYDLRIDKSDGSKYFGIDWATAATFNSSSLI